ncbi:hypothetical protein J3R82DRAFT_4186 [Butyriboletus roseoflavus]|nr:hypothetical protein J3R82DRAFT_4186 [Butyriboletus roseoflavus]
MFVDETVESLETSLEHCDPCTEDRDGIERESLSQPLVNVSQDMCLIVTGAKPQACPALSPSKFLSDVIPSEQYSQAPTSGAQVAFSQQPSPEFLMSLGIKVRDFAYENTLPAIVPVPRVPRQVQPAPRALKRLQREWDDKEGYLNGLSPAQPLSGQTGSKKPRSLERQPTEPLQEPAVQHTRALERIIVKRVCSIVTPPPRRTLQTTPCTRLSTTPPTSPLTPPLSHLASQESEFVQTPPAFPFVVHVDDTSTIPAPQLDSESQSLSLQPIIYTRLTLDSRSSSGCSPAPSPPQNASSAPLITPFLELPSPIKESGTDTRVRKRRAVDTIPLNRYQLRQRPIPSSRASTVSRYSKSLPRRTRRVR